MQILVTFRSRTRSTSNALSPRLVVRLTRPNPLATSTTQAESSNVTEKIRRGRRLAYNVKELTRLLRV